MELDCQAPALRSLSARTILKLPTLHVLREHRTIIGSLMLAAENEASAKSMHLSCMRVEDLLLALRPDFLSVTCPATKDPNQASACMSQRCHRDADYENALCSALPARLSVECRLHAVSLSEPSPAPRSGGGGSPVYATGGTRESDSTGAARVMLRALKETEKPMSVPNSDLRLQIVDLVVRPLKTHPRLLHCRSHRDLYRTSLEFDVSDLDGQGETIRSQQRARRSALYVTLVKFGLLQSEDPCNMEPQAGSWEGPRRHMRGTWKPAPDRSAWLSSAVGIALGLRIQSMKQGVCAAWRRRVYEGHLGSRQHAAISSWLPCAQSWTGTDRGAQLMSIDDLPAKWRAFGWDVVEIDGHDVPSIEAAYASALRKPRTRLLHHRPQ